MIWPWLKQKLQRPLIRRLGGHDPVTTGFLMYRAGLLSDLANTGRFSPELKPLIEAQIRCVRSAILELEHGRGKYAALGCKPSFRELEASSTGTEGVCLVCARRLASRARSASLLDANGRSSIGFSDSNQ